MVHAEPSHSAAAQSTSIRSAPRTWLVILAACAGQFLVVLDVSVVNVALPSMRADLGLSATGRLGVPPRPWA